MPSREFIDRVNAVFSVKKLLYKMGIEPKGNSAVMYCPFHPDESGGKVSARYYEDTNSIYCFGRCRKPYRAYDVLKLGGATDVDIFKAMRKKGIADIEIEHKNDNRQLLTIDKAMEWKKELLMRHHTIRSFLSEYKRYLQDKVNENAK